MNVYSDLSHAALKYLKDIEVCIQNLLIMTGDFNIHDSLWNLLFPHHSSISDDLLIIADSFNLELSNPTNHVLTRYSDNEHDLNSVIDLMFLWNSTSELDNHLIHPDWRLSSNHMPLTITIPIVEKHINTSKWSIAKDSEEEATFIKGLTSSFRNINTSFILDITSLEWTVNAFTKAVEITWEKNAKTINITKHSKSWWDDSCSRDLEKYRSLKSLENWKQFHYTVKNTKQHFFDLKIQEISNKRRGL